MEEIFNWFWPCISLTKIQMQDEQKSKKKIKAAGSTSSLQKEKKRSTIINAGKYHNSVRSILKGSGTANNSQPLFFYHCSAEGWEDFKTAIMNNRFALKSAPLLPLSLLPLLLLLNKEVEATKKATSWTQETKGDFREYPQSQMLQKREKSRAWLLGQLLKTRAVQLGSLAK